ncbi:MAG: gliding motility-associated C-terminal domain-containing protein [Bacteroidota bacterium]
MTILPNQTPGPPFDPPLTDPSYGTPVASGTFADNGTGIGAANATSVIITNLNSGRYTIGINVNDGDECITNVLSETIADPEEPSVTLNTSSDNGICDVSGALTFNGSITVDASHPSLANAADFTWYEDLDDNGTYVALQAGNGSGSGFNVANETEAGVTTNTVSGLGAGKYRVVIENNATACTDTLDVELFDDPVELTAQIGVDAAAPTNIVNCGGVGSFTLNQVRENGVANVNVAADFTTTWTRNGAAFTPDSEDADADLPVGNYELTIVRDNTGCRTTLGFSIDDDTENPIIDLVNETDNSICDGGPLTPNGAIQIQVVDNLNNVLTAGDYTYAWFFGSGTGNTLDAGDLTDGAGLAGLGTNTISGLEAGIYTVVVTDNAGTSLACFAQAEFEVENAQLPVAIQQDLGTDYTIQHQINCTPNENGTITLLNVYENGTAVAVNANYTFTWYDDNVGTPLSVGTISGASNQTVSDLPSGNYFVEVTNVNTDCVSPLVSFEIEDDRDFPNVQISFTAQDTECETATGNGSVVAQVVATGGGFETVTDYTWIWFEGTGTGTALGTSVSGFTATNNVVTDLPSGTYTVQVQDNTSTCSRTETIVLPQFTPVISISDAQVSLTAQTNCAGNENGTATVNELQFTNPDGSVTNVTLPDADWQIDWHTTVSGGAAFITDNEAATGLTGGTTYFIQATNTATSCLINPRKAVTIPTDISPVELTINQNSPDQFCSPMTAGNGQLAVAIEIDGVLQDPTQYTVEWFVGSGTGTPIGTSALTGFSLQNNDTTLTNIPNGTYTVRATKNGTAPTAPGIGCANTAEGSITISEEEIVLISGDFTTSPNTICNPAAAAGGISNGSITIVDVTEGGVSTGGTAGFTFAWTGENGVVITTQAPNASGNTGTSISGLVKGTYEVTITNTSRGCDSEVIQIEVSENFTLPSLAVTGTNDNTHCAGAPTFTGSIAVQASGGTGPYSFVWHDGSNPSGGTTGTIASTSPNSTASNLDGDSFYTVVVTDDATGCTVTETYFVDNVITIPVLELSGIETLPDTTCAGHPNDPSGAIIIDDNDITGVLTDYTITLERGAVGSGIVLAGAFVAGTPATLTYTSLEPADYFFTATNPTTGCSIAPVRVNVEDSTRNPQIGLVTITPDQNCGGATNYGGIEIVIDDSFDHTAARFDVQWHDGFGAASAIAGANTVSISGVAAGNYSVEVTNNLTGCSQTEDFIIPNQIVRPSITMSQVGNNTTCDDDGNNLPVDVGSYEVTQTTYDGSSIDPRTVPADYSLAIFPDASLTPGSEIVDNDGATPFLYEELSTGDYYAVITHIPSGCTSNSSRFDIIDVLTRPAVAITLLQADSTCSSATANGSLFGRVFIDGINDIDDTHPSFGNYTFQWYTGSGAVPGNEIAAGSGGNSSTVSNLVTGTYTLEVTLDSTGCTTEEEFILPNAPTYVEIINATPTPSTNCIGNGSAVITTMNRTDPLFTPSNFTFDYFDTDPTVGSPTPIIDDGNESALSGVMAGTYYVIGTHATLLCTTPVFEIEILQSVDPPVVFLDDFRFQTNCNPAIPDGRLTINVDGTPTPSVTDYTIQWYRNSVDPANIITGEDSATIDSIAAGIYVARVTSNLTGCFTDYNEVMDDDILDPYGVQISTQGNISCVAPFDGSANARVIIPIRKDQSQHHERNVSDYGYLWYLGDVSSPNPTAYNEANALIDSLEEGVYTVLVIDSVDNSCVYEPIRVEVEDLTSPPRYSTFEVNPVTVCYEDDRVNGSVVLAVDTADTKNENVIVEWFDDSGNLISNNPTILSPLDVGTYSLRLTNPTTGCVTNETFFIDRVVNPPVAPTVIANGNRTSCSTANGSAIANVNGITTGYEFEWFNTNDLTTPYTTGSSVTNLDSATYLVRATDIATGCQSPFTSVTFDYVITDIEFEMDISVATCSRTVDGAVNQFNTLVRVEIDNETNPILPGLDEREATNFEWRNANGDIIENESDQLLDVAPGNYTVTFTARNGCTYTSAFNVSTDIEVYNGLSPNDDGLNDFLLIDCIDYFAGNKVQIFNRDGIKVYEINGYDNVNNRFEGFSNVGGGGLSLPTGTYFAVVELNDGKDPVQFYLELVR